MPLTACKVGNKSGFKWGKGHCYTGKDAKKLALKQGYVEGPKKFEEEVGKSSVSTQPELDEFYDEIITKGEEEALQESLGDERYNLVNAYIKQAERDKLKESDFAWPEKRKFPITSQKQVDSAARLLGRAPKEMQAKIKEAIKRIAKKKGFSIPKDWE